MELRPIEQPQEQQWRRLGAPDRGHCSARLEKRQLVGKRKIEGGWKAEQSLETFAIGLIDAH